MDLSDDLSMLPAGSEPTPVSPVVTTNSTCDGPRFKLLLGGALAWLEQNYKRVDDLNVFPVPDGDTGTNMLLTIRNAYKEISSSEAPEIGLIAVRFAHGALRGSRGNSGTILSEILRGFAYELSGQTTADGATFARAFRASVKLAYGVVQQPVEGTILTVAREVANAVDAAAVETDDLREILRRALLQGQDTLRRTPDMLPILKKAGVVDSGGQGLVYLLEGMYRQSIGEALIVAAGSDSLTGNVDLRQTLTAADPLGYGYDVQFIVQGQKLDIARIRHDVGLMGDSMVVVGDEHLIKVHIHVHDPGVPLSYAVKLGMLADIVVENMQAQSETYIDQRLDEPNAAPHNPDPPEVVVNPEDIAVVAVVPGDGLQRVFRGLGVAAVIDGGQSMNPSSGELLDAITALPAMRVIVLPNNKNIQLTAEQAAKMAVSSDKEVRVVPTRTIPQGIAALLSFNAEGELNTAVEAMSSARLSVVTGEVTSATRSIQLDGIDVREGQFIGLIDGTLTLSGDNLNSVVRDLLWRMHITDRELVTIYYGADQDAAEADTLTESLRTAYPAQEFEVFEGGQPHYYYILSVE